MQRCRWTREVGDNGVPKRSNFLEQSDAGCRCKGMKGAGMRMCMVLECGNMKRVGVCWCWCLLRSVFACGGVLAEVPLHNYSRTLP